MKLKQTHENAVKNASSCNYIHHPKLFNIIHFRVAQEHEEAQLRRMRELEERLAADRRDRLTVGHDRR